MNAYIADKIFTGTEWLPAHAVLTQEDMITDIIPAADLPEDAVKENFESCFIAPAFIDLQIYGAYGKLFAVYPEPSSLEKLNEYCREGGAPYCLPTAATNKKEVFYACIDAIRAYWKQGGEGIL